MGLLVLLSARARAYEVVPIVNGSLMGGQYFFQGARSSLSGNASLVASPVVKMTQWSLMPMYSGGYQGTKGVGESVGAGTLFQEQMDHRLSFSALRPLKGSTPEALPQ